jgi:hypothetical protein
MKSRSLFLARAAIVALCLAATSVALGAQSEAASWIGKWLYSPPPGGEQ